MDKTTKDELKQKRQMLHDNQLIMNKKRMQLKNKNNFKDYVFLVNKWKVVVYIFYFIALPYIAGVLLLFFFVAGGNLENFQLLNLSAFSVIWLIGYEIAAICLLLWIVILYVKRANRKEH
ncbi:hypothetical protein [Sulfurimonas sp.]